MTTTEVPGWPAVFRGSWAVRAGLLSPAQVKGVRFRRLFPDVYVPATSDTDLRLRSHAAFLHMQTRGVLSGYAAAELHGAGCAPTADVLPDITVPGGGIRQPPGLRLHRETLREDEVVTVAGLPVTSPRRTAFDLGRWADRLSEAVASVDRLANHCRFGPAQILALDWVHPAMRGCARLPEVVELADCRSGSRPETLLRLLLHDSGFPPPEVQWVVQDPGAREAVWIDLAYPTRRVGIEYEGAPHMEPEQVLKDIARTTMLTDRGWRMLRFTKNDVFRRPEYIVATVDRALNAPR